LRVEGEAMRVRVELKFGFLQERMPPHPWGFKHPSFRRWSKPLIRVTLDFLDYICWLLRKLWCSSVPTEHLTDTQILSRVQVLFLLS
jgi:hypothetical protein